MKSLPLTDFSNPICYVLIRESKVSPIVSSALTLIMISMLSLLECITHSSSLWSGEIKVIAIVN